MLTLESIRRIEKELDRRFEGKLVINHDLDRTLVSFQANKRQTRCRWFKYKEGFSALLVRYLLDKLQLDSGRLLDPFAGSGATLFGAAARGLDSVGIELLPVGCQVIEARKRAASADAPVIAARLGRWLDKQPWRTEKEAVPFRHLRITQGAFPSDTEKSLGHYLAAADKEVEPARTILRFAALCILEEVSYTRKDGQYLRWDYRSGRKQGVKPFDKGAIASFNSAIGAKLAQIRDDLRGESLDLFPEPESGRID
ncbi:MAG: site-specific DNA-methyltransferase, partial [Gemmataceae bacterium]